MCACACVALWALACDTADAPSAPTPVEPPSESPPGTGWVRSWLTPLGGYRLDIPYAGEGLAIATDVEGVATALFTSGHVQQHVVHRTPLAIAPMVDTLVTNLPVLVPHDTSAVESLFPGWLAGQRLRDLAVIPSSTGAELAALGRVFYNTTPRDETRLMLRTLDAAGQPTGATRFLPVPLPEQEFSGFIKHADARTDLTAIGGGGYESGQGSVGGISYAVARQGTWQRLLQPPAFGDLTSTRLPRDTAYTCPDGASWLCLPPVNGRGVWSTERVYGGGVRLGDTVLLVPTLGYGARTYERQSATFGDPALDRAVAYRFTHVGGRDSVVFAGYERWPFAAPGQPVLGLALGRLNGVTEQVLFVLVGNAWGRGVYADAPVLQLYRVRGTTARAASARQH
jgi:hypothetical protein